MPKEEKNSQSYKYNLLDHKPQLIQFFKRLHIDDIINESEIVEVDTTTLIASGLDEIVNSLIDDTERTLPILSNAYKEAYFSIKNENTNAVITIKKLPMETTN